MNILEKGDMLSTSESENNEDIEEWEISLKYWTGANKLNTIDMWNCPCTKLLMIKWIADSIKQDNELRLRPGDDSIHMWADTMVRIYAFIIAMSGNNLLYSHLHFIKQLYDKDSQSLWAEGYYMCILEAALSSLCEYENLASELMISINNFETSLEKLNQPIDGNEEIELYWDSFIETSPTPTGLVYKDHEKDISDNFSLFTFKRAQDESQRF